MFEVRVSRSAAAYLKRLDRTIRERVLAKLDELAGDPCEIYRKL